MENKVNLVTTYLCMTSNAYSPIRKLCILSDRAHIPEVCMFLFDISAIKDLFQRYWGRLRREMSIMISLHP